MRENKRLCAAVLALIIAICAAAPALAAGYIDTSKPATLNIDYKIQAADGDTPLVGATFHLYRVADVNSAGELTATADFAAYFTNYTGGNHAADWQAQATTLEAIAQRDEIAAADSGQTDTNGLLAFPTGGKTLLPGLYLLTGERLTQNGYRYDATPCFIMLPTENDNNEWSYTATCIPKYASSHTPGNHHSSTSRSVVKIWADSDNEANRPTEVTVQLLSNGKVYDTVTLSAANNWRHTWSNLSDNNRWTLTETAVPGYTTTVTQDGKAFVVTNTYPTTPPGGDEPGGGEPDGGTPPGGENGGDNGANPPRGNAQPPETTPDTPTLPQTGQLWWPVPIMLLSGLTLILLGLIRKRGESYEK